MIKKRITKISNEFISLICQPYFLQLSLVFTAFIIPLIILYTLDPGSFEFLWKGRAPFLLFIWLLFRYSSATERNTPAEVHRHLRNQDKWISFYS